MPSVRQHFVRQGVLFVAWSPFIKQKSGYRPSLQEKKNNFIFNRSVVLTKRMNVNLLGAHRVKIKTCKLQSDIVCQSGKNNVVLYLKTIQQNLILPAKGNLITS